MSTEARPVRRRRVTFADGHTEVDRSVACRESGGSSPLDECAACARCLAMPADTSAPDAEVLCRIDGPPARANRLLPVDLVEVALRTPILAVAPKDVLAVEADVPVAMARRLLAESGAPALVVVDAARRPLGVVTASALLDTLAGVVGEVARPADALIADDTALVHALPGLVDTGSGTYLPVVTSQGELVSLLASVDVVRWLASRAGYEV